ncbi:MAG: hypothetical protein KAR40_05490 [Candidatus Sabulitectum sp.]|nr:hypothetical protein [Candidatus Sabulitectum sp.]
MLSSGKANAVDRYRNRSLVYDVPGHELKAGEGDASMAAISMYPLFSSLATLLGELARICLHYLLELLSCLAFCSESFAC